MNKNEDVKQEENREDKPEWQEELLRLFLGRSNT